MMVSGLSGRSVPSRTSSEVTQYFVSIVREAGLAGSRSVVIMTPSWAVPLIVSTGAAVIATVPKVVVALPRSLPIVTAVARRAKAIVVNAFCHVEVHEKALWEDEL